MRTLVTLVLAVVFSNVVFSQQLNKEITLDGEAPFLLGEIDKEGLTSKHYIGWFSQNYIDYELDHTVVSALASNLKSFDILVFMGTWCGDSKREIPRFYKLLEAAEFPLDQLTVVAVSRLQDMYKQSPNHEEAGLNIHRVPTFIFYKNGQEINRIVEHPVESLEQDVLNIVNGNDYTPNYEIVQHIDKVLLDKGVKGLKSKRNLLLEMYKDKVSSLYELNTYSRILYTTDRFDEAIAVLKLNTMLFPEDPYAYQSLANTLYKTGQHRKALKVLKKALKQFPGNEDLTQQLQALDSRSEEL